MKFSIIIPCFDEADNIASFAEELFPHLSGLDYQLIFVDDGSSDSTYSELLRLKSGSVCVLKHERNRGMGAAIKTGIRYSTGQFIVTLDADMTFHPRYIKDLIDAQKSSGSDCVIGSHVMGSMSKDIPIHRFLLTRFSNWLYSFLLGKRITAITPIFRLYRASLLRGLHIDSDDFNINAEILFKLIQQKARIVEVAVPLGMRKHGVSKMNLFKEIKNHLKLIVRIISWRISGRQ